MKIVFSFLLFFNEVSFGQAKSLECKEAPVQKSTSCSLQKKAPHTAILSDATAIEKECEKLTISAEFAEAAINTGEVNNKVPTIGTLKKEIEYFKKLLESHKEGLEGFKAFKENFEEAKKKAVSKKEAHDTDHAKMMSLFHNESDPEGKTKLMSDFKKKYPSSFFYIPSDMSTLDHLFENQKQKIANLESELAQAEARLAQLIEAKAKGDTSHDEKLIDAVTQTLAPKIQQMKNSSKFKDCGLTTEEIAAIYWYTGSLYRDINEALRSNNAESLQKYQLLIKAINSGLEKLKPYSEVVMRGSLLPSKVASQHCIGCLVVYDAFTSTSTGKGFGGSSKFVIKSKKGRYIAPLSWAGSEEEVLFKPGTKFKVLNIETTNEGYPQYTMEELE